MDAIFYFVLAALIASLGITIAVRSSMDKFVAEPSKLQEFQTRLFIQVFAIEAIPILLIIVGFMHLQNSTANAILPLGVVLLSLFVNFILLFSKKNELLSHEPKVQSALNNLFFIGLALMAALPIVAIVAILIR
ncbi:MULTISPECIES: hypothetical protein [Bacillus]|uniref:hypothetical protein n=1 Tax=Bacillus TaxID=1386 RepID=UPI000BB6E05A|nr:MULTISPECIES: hypothetical protein [Bacillus]